MKKLKVILITVVSILLICFLVEYITYQVQSNSLIKQGYKFFGDVKKPPYPTNITLFSNFYENSYKHSILSDVAGTKYSKNPILVFGDVFAEVFSSSEDNVFTKKLADYSTRPVFNFANAGWDIQHMYFLLKNEEALSTIENPKAIIYVFNRHQTERMNTFSYYAHHPFLQQRYMVAGESLVEKVPSALFLYNSYFFRILEKTIGVRGTYSLNPNTRFENLNLVQKLFEESKRVAQTRYKNLDKFIILRFVPESLVVNSLREQENMPISQLEYNMWKKLEEQGFEIIDAFDLIDDKSNYQIFDSNPEEETLDEIIPRLLDRVNL